MRFVNKFADRVYKYLYIHDQETLLLKDIARDTGICDTTCRKYIRWLEKRGYIKKNGKYYEILTEERNF